MPLFWPCILLFLLNSLLPITTNAHFADDFSKLEISNDTLENFILKLEADYQPRVARALLFNTGNYSIRFHNGQPIYHLLTRNRKISDTGRYSFMKYGFPAHLLASKIAPVTTWYMPEKNEYYGFRSNPTVQELSLSPLRLWELIHPDTKPKCDELKNPNCGWRYFLYYYHIFEIDVTDHPVYNGKGTQITLPYIRDSCYPLDDYDAFHIMYRYYVCLIFWNDAGFEKDRCPNTCEEDPCKTITYAIEGSCTRTGIHQGEFECSCDSGYSWNKPSARCVARKKHQEAIKRECKKCNEKTTYDCVLDLETSENKCLCKTGYTGSDCSRELNACLDTSDPDMTTILTKSGNEACGIAKSHENICIPILRTMRYSCECGKRFKRDLTVGYDNCELPQNPCASNICYQGTCEPSSDNTVGVCNCKPGWHGKHCHIRVGQWSSWSSWSSCHPICSKIRKKKESPILFLASQLSRPERTS